MHLRDMLDHVALTHPSLHADTIATLLRALEGRGMIFSQMHSEELLCLKGVISSFLTSFTRTIKASSLIFGTYDDVVVANDVLLEMIFALEAILTAIPKASQSHAFMPGTLQVCLKKDLRCRLTCDNMYKDISSPRFGVPSGVE